MNHFAFTNENINLFNLLNQNMSIKLKQKKNTQIYF